MKITKQYRTETGHRLCNYNGKCAHYHGHSYLWEVTAEATILDDRGMVMDFSELKAAMKQTLDPFDHTMVLNYQDPAVDVMLGQLSTNGEVQRLILFRGNPTAEAFAKYAAHNIQHLIRKAGVFYITQVVCWETASSCAVYSRTVSEAVAQDMADNKGREAVMEIIGV